MGIVTVLTSGKGGVGKSTLAAGIGCALAEKGQKVLIIDGDAGMGSLDIILGVSQKKVFDLSDVFEGKCEPFRAIYRSPVYRGVSMIPAPRTLDKLATQRDMRRMCRGYARHYDQVLIDCPAGIGPGFSAACGAADRALVISTPDLVCARDGAIVGQMLKHGGISARLIINRLRATPIIRGKAPDVDDVIDAVGVRLIGVVPEDEVLAFSAANGQPLAGNRPSVEAYRNIARRLLGENVPLMDLQKNSP